MSIFFYFFMKAKCLKKITITAVSISVPTTQKNKHYFYVVVSNKISITLVLRRIMQREYSGFRFKHQIPNFYLNKTNY